MQVKSELTLTDSLQGLKRVNVTLFHPPLLTRTHTQRLFTCVKPCVLLSVVALLQLHNPSLLRVGLSNTKIFALKGFPEDKINRLRMRLYFVQ